MGVFLIIFSYIKYKRCRRSLVQFPHMLFDVNAVAEYIVSLHPDKIVRPPSCAPRDDPSVVLYFLSEYTVSLHPDKIVRPPKCATQEDGVVLYFLPGPVPFMELIARKFVIEGRRLDCRGYIWGRDWPELEASIKKFFHDEWEEIPDNVSYDTTDSGYYHPAGMRYETARLEELNDMVEAIEPLPMTTQETPLFEADFKDLRRIRLAKGRSRSPKRAHAPCKKIPRVHMRAELLSI